LLTVELAPERDVAVGRQTRQHGPLDGRLVRHRQCARHAEAHRAHPRVGLPAEGDRAPAEHLRVHSGDLGVDLETDHGFVACKRIEQPPTHHLMHHPSRPTRHSPAAGPDRSRRRLERRGGAQDRGLRKVVTDDLYSDRQSRART